MNILAPKEHNQYIIIREYIEGKITRKQASLMFNITPKWASILKNKYLKYGKIVFQHGNKEKTNVKRTPNAVESKITELYLGKYSGFNFTHFYEQIIENGELIKVTRTNPPTPCGKNGVQNTCPQWHQIT